MIINNKIAAYAHLRKTKDIQIGMLLEAVMYDSDIIQQLAADGPATIRAGFEGEKFTHPDASGNEVGLSDDEARMLQALAPGCRNYLELATRIHFASGGH